MLPYKEGTVFALPLRRGGYAIGIVARTSALGGLFLGYLFGPVSRVIPSLKDVENLRPEDALRIARIGDLSLMEKTWPIIGQIPSWIHEEWPIPPFIRRDDIAKKAWQVQYADTDANKVIAEKPMDYSTAAEFERDAVLGAGAAEIAMTKILVENLG